MTPFSLLPSLRSSKEEGQSNFVNPGLTLVGVGADFDGGVRRDLEAPVPDADLAGRDEDVAREARELLHRQMLGRGHELRIEVPAVQDRNPCADVAQRRSEQHRVVVRLGNPGAAPSHEVDPLDEGHLLRRIVEPRRDEQRAQALSQLPVLRPDLVAETVTAGLGDERIGRALVEAETALAKGRGRKRTSGSLVTRKR